MRAKDHIKLCVLSQIDGNIIDEVTDSRITFTRNLQMNAKRAHRRRIAIGSIAASLVLICAITLMFLIPLFPSPSYVPVYQGMTVRKTAAPSVSVPLSNNRFSFMSLNATSRNTQKDEHEAPDTSLGEDIRDMVDFRAEGDDEVRYYVQPNETFIIEVHISNPKDYEIQSFTLNGKKYANYMFREGSTMEMLLLEVTAPPTSGYFEYTIDAIKYIEDTEIKDVDMSSGDKSIQVGVAYPTAPSAEVLAQSVSMTELELTVHIDDPYALIGDSELTLYLSDGERIVDSKKLTVGDNTVRFSDLLMSKTYEYGVLTTYDLADGHDIREVWLLTDRITTEGAYAITNVVPTNHSITFAVEQDGESGTVTSISLYDATTNELVQTADTNARSFENLLSNHTYNLYVDFTYTVNGEEIRDWVTMRGITTLAKTAPVLTFGETSSDQTSVSYAVDAIDPDGLLHVSKIELLKDGVSVQENGSALSGQFAGLLSNTPYTVKVTYTYDLNDGLGVRTETAEKKIPTVAKTAPTFTFRHIDVTDTGITGSIHMKDDDATATLTSVDLYRNGARIQSNAAGELSFSALEYYTDYQVVVSYTYDLNDGVGVQTATATYDFKTAPQLIFNSFSVVNTSDVSEGDTIFLKVDITNPNCVTYQKIVINGRTYDVATNSSTSTMLICNIVNNGQFEGGNTTLTIEEVIATTPDGQTCSIEPQSNNTADVFINGRIEVRSLEVVVEENGQYVTRDYVFPQDKTYLRIELSNKTGYNLDSVTIGSGECTDLIKLDDEHYLLEVSSNLMFSTLSAIRYSRDDFSRTETVQISYDQPLRLEDDTIHYVSTADDLLHMNSGAKYYELTNDIDLSGIEWHGKTLIGVFNGNGYSIKNMSFVGTVTNGANIGLFSDALGVIENVHLEDVMLIVKHEHTEDIPYTVNIGSFVGMSGYNLVIKNCSLDEKSFINFTCDVSQSTHCICTIGGIAPYATKISNCVNNGTITANANSGMGFVRIGGISFTVSNSTTSQHNSIIVENCIHNGSITVISGAGGEIAGISTYDSTIINCVNNGTLSTPSGIPRAYPLCLEHASNTVQNSYALTDKNTAELSSKEFYTDQLGFDEAIWDFEDLDVANGKYPTLK